MTIQFVFDERKTAQAAALLLHLQGGRMPYISMIKLLYLADRRSLLEKGAPITGDLWVSMKNGPVLSTVLDLITHGPSTEPSPWFDHVSGPVGYDVEAKRATPEVDELSEYENRVLQEIHRDYGRMDRWALVRLTHTLPEWVDPGMSAVRISPEDILRAENKSQEHIERVAAAAREACFFARECRG